METYKTGVIECLHAVWCTHEKCNSACTQTNVCRHYYANGVSQSVVRASVRAILHASLLFLNVFTQSHSNATCHGRNLLSLLSPSRTGARKRFKEFCFCLSAVLETPLICAGSWRLVCFERTKKNRCEESNPDRPTDRQISYPLRHRRCLITSCNSVR